MRQSDGPWCSAHIFQHSRMAHTFTNAYAHVQVIKLSTCDLYVFFSISRRRAYASQPPARLVGYIFSHETHCMRFACSVCLRNAVESIMLRFDRSWCSRIGMCRHFTQRISDCLSDRYALNVFLFKTATNKCAILANFIDGIGLYHSTITTTYITTNCYYCWDCLTHYV